MLIQILFSRNPRALISRHLFCTLVMFIFSLKKYPRSNILKQIHGKQPNQQVQHKARRIL